MDGVAYLAVTTLFFSLVSHCCLLELSGSKVQLLCNKKVRALEKSQPILQPEIPTPLQHLCMMTESLRIMHVATKG